MAEAGTQEKTEAPTQKKREDARKEGRVAMSKEVSSAMLLGGFLLFMLVAGGAGIQEIQRIWIGTFQNLQGPDMTIDQLYSILRNNLFLLTSVLFGLFALIFLIGLFSSVVQVGVHFTGLKFQGSRINPLNGIKRTFSANGLAELFKGLFKMSVIGYITFVSIENVMTELLSLSRLPLSGIFDFNFNLLALLFGRVAIALVALAVFDYLFQRWQFEQQIKMTKLELKEELKQTEGDPQLRARVRQIQREITRVRMMQNVPKADVVVTNPTHYAVALEYDREIMTAPKVTAKGADFIAQRIRAIAEENEVPIMENPVVAREIYQQVEIGYEVPEKFFRAVAEILAYVYRLKGKTAEPSSPQEEELATDNQ